MNVERGHFIVYKNGWHGFFLTEYCEHLDRKRRHGAANCQRWLCA
jgi:hypothetical protein